MTDAESDDRLRYEVEGSEIVIVPGEEVRLPPKMQEMLKQLLGTMSQAEDSETAYRRAALELDPLINERDEKHAHARLRLSQFWVHFARMVGPDWFVNNRGRFEIDRDKSRIMLTPEEGMQPVGIDAPGIPPHPNAAR